MGGRGEAVVTHLKLLLQAMCQVTPPHVGRQYCPAGMTSHQALGLGWHDPQQAPSSLTNHPLFHPAPKILRYANVSNYPVPSYAVRAFLVPSMCATRLTHLNLLNVSILISDDQYSLLHSPVTSSLSAPNILHSTVINTLSSSSSLIQMKLQIQIRQMNIQFHFFKSCL